MKNVVLIWQSYQTKEYIPIGILSELENKTYKWQFLESAKEAENQGCFLPFKYTEEIKQFDSLPPFFNRRLLVNPFIRSTFDIDIPTRSTLELLTYSNSKINNDNFQIMTEESIRELALRPGTRKM